MTIVENADYPNNMGVERLISRWERLSTCTKVGDKQGGRTFGVQSLRAVADCVYVLGLTSGRVGGAAVALVR